MPQQIITFYKFKNLTTEQVEDVRAKLHKLAEQVDALAQKPLTLRGLGILGTEGLNATFSVEKNYADFFKTELLKILDVSELNFKDSYSDKQPFHDFVIKIRDEIVTLSRPDLLPTHKNFHLSPKEWHKVISEENPVIIDTRNSFEYEVGHFKNAIDPKTEEFKEFPEWLKNNPQPKDKKILIYCTGGIRCEKAILNMHEQGYDNVYQLDGGIINYLNEYPNEKFEGECFVFDYRVALDQRLEPTKIYKYCPHCGQPGTLKLDCVQCGVSETVCKKCADKSPEFQTCSKNCAHHYRLGHKTTRVHEDAFRNRNAQS
jgi:UPF0176 protein